ncbi:MAG: hypothetical protein D6795_16680, partial [Deltaproteobacteria bacterium]
MEDAEGNWVEMPMSADDHIWSVAVCYLPNAEDDPDGDGIVTFNYGAQDDKGGWIWVGPNGAVDVPLEGSAGTTIHAQGLTIPPFGPWDLKLTIDINALYESFSIKPTDNVEVKGSYTSWGK